MPLERQGRGRRSGRLRATGLRTLYTVSLVFPCPDALSDHAVRGRIRLDDKEGSLRLDRHDWQGPSEEEPNSGKRPKDAQDVAEIQGIESVCCGWTAVSDALAFLLFSSPGFRVRPSFLPASSARVGFTREFVIRFSLSFASSFSRSHGTVPEHGNRWKRATAREVRFSIS
eukprot:scaffold2532_cov243-Pinguiococcus_pyrenoidosus.AAC.1